MNLITMKPKYNIVYKITPYRSGIGRTVTDPTDNRTEPTIYNANEYNIVRKFPHQPSETIAPKIHAKYVIKEFEWKIIVAVSLS